MATVQRLTEWIKNYQQCFRTTPDNATKVSEVHAANMMLSEFLQHFVRKRLLHQPDPTEGYLGDFDWRMHSPNPYVSEDGLMNETTIDRLLRDIGTGCAYLHSKGITVGFVLLDEPVFS
jgi:hypothetical protein